MYKLVLFILILFYIQAFSKDVYVKSYFKKDGTFVSSHFRSAPDGNPYNNYSTKGNYNPYTGKEGTKTQYAVGGVSSFEKPQTVISWLKIETSAMFQALYIAPKTVEYNQDGLSCYVLSKVVYGDTEDRFFEIIYKDGTYVTVAFSRITNNEMDSIHFYNNPQPNRVQGPIMQGIFNFVWPNHD